MGSYELGSQKIIPAVLLYASFEGSILMMHRNSNPNDFHKGKWNGLGGKLNIGETPLEAATREFSEESFCSVPKLQWLWMGQLFFPNFKPLKKEDWWVNVFVCDLSREQAEKIPINSNSTHEGALRFIEKIKVLELNLWEGDHKFLPLVLERTPFHGTFFYQDGKCIKHELAKVNFK